MFKTFNTRRPVLRLLALTIPLALTAFVHLPASAQAAKPPVKIGVVLSLSGPAASFGIPEREAVNAIYKELAPTGMYDGRKVDLVYFDDKSNPTEAARGVTQLINDEKVAVIIGPGTGSNILAAGPIAARLGVPLLAPAGTVAITDKKNAFHPWIFRIAVSDSVAVPALLNAAVKAGGKRIGVIYQEDAYGKFGLELTQKLAPQIGYQFAESVSAQYSATDLTSHAVKLRNANVDTVILQMAIPSLGAAFLNAAHEVGLKARFYAVLGLSQKGFVDAAGARGEGVHVASMGTPVSDAAGPEQKLIALLTKNGAKPQGMAEFMGGNGIMTALAAIKAINGPITGAKMRDTIETLCGFETYSRGKPCFSKDNHDGWGSDALVITTIRNGALRAN
ncbi:MAG: ABC transporter substrate-binding protein [Burkholderiaceae bacterium]|nr:ABC transporter substrate-binding protein [Burkholderiaceae bacterium]